MAGLYNSGQIITTSAAVTLNGGLIREISLLNEELFRTPESPKSQGRYARAIYLYYSKISPTYPWKIPQTFHQQFMRIPPKTPPQRFGKITFGPL